MLVLASRSPHRRAMLEAVGLRIEPEPSTIDERAVEAALDGELGPVDLAEMLAETKAVDVSPRHPGAVVIGCDQVLELDGEVLHKVNDMEGARRRLLQLSGRTHLLHSAVVLVREGRTLWRGVETAEMTMRTLVGAEVGRTLALSGPGVLGSVGCYQIEGPGLALFERVEGDWWTVVGLPLLPLLGALREFDAFEENLRA